MPSATEPPTKERLTVLAHTIEVAAFGPDGVFDPDWLSYATGELIVLCHGLLRMSSDARLAQDDAPDALIGAR